jgi:hypothetical protein
MFESFNLPGLPIGCSSKYKLAANMAGTGYQLMRLMPVQAEATNRLNTDKARRAFDCSRQRPSKPHRMMISGTSRW